MSRSEYPDLTKICSKCFEVKLLSEFYWKDKKKRELMAHCKKCHQVLVNRWKHEHLERARELSQKASKKHYDKTKKIGG